MYKERLNYELSIILECIVCQFHRSLAMKLIDSRARLLERVERVGRVCMFVIRKIVCCIHVLCMLSLQFNSLS